MIAKELSDKQRDTKDTYKNAKEEHITKTEYEQIA